MAISAPARSMHSRKFLAAPHHPVPITPENVLGILSLVFWALTIVVTIKYVGFMLRADNKGEGGIMALMALALRNAGEGSRRRHHIDAGSIWRRIVLWRRSHYAGHLGAFGGRGAGGRHPGIQALHNSIIIDRADRLVHDSASWHGQRWRTVRADNAGSGSRRWQRMGIVNIVHHPRRHASARSAPRCLRSC